MTAPRHGFSLVEVLLALGVFSFTVLGLLAVLGSSLQLAGDVQSDYRVHLIAENLQSRFLLDSEWLKPPVIGEQELHLTAEGKETEPDAAAFRVRLEPVGFPNWSSPYLQSLAAEIQTKQGALIETFLLSRAVKPVR